MHFIGMEAFGDKKKRQEKKAARQEKREDRKEARQEKKEDRKEKRQEKKVVRQTKRATKKTARVEKRAAKKEVRQTKRQERGGSRLKKVALAVPRAGFAVVLKLNLFKLASKFAQAYTKNPAEVKKFAARFGYKWSNFAKLVNQGAKSQISGNYEAFGEPTAAAAIASATAIIGAAVVFLKKLGINPEKELSEAIGRDPDLFQDDPGIVASDSEPGAAPPEPAESESGFPILPLLLLAGIGVYAYKNS